MPRFYDPQPITANQPLVLGQNAAHHATRVLRLNTGDELTLFNGEGGEWDARIKQIEGKTVTVLPHTFRDIDRTPSRQVTLWLPLIKGDRLDWALQKVTEMGAARICLYTSERTEVRLKDKRLEKKQQRWQHTLISACEQCGMNRLPELMVPQPLSHLLESGPQGTGLLAQPNSEPLAKVLPKDDSPLTLLTGPEGGFSPAERQAAKDTGCNAFSLGERVLRAETAPVAVLGGIWGLAVDTAQT